MKKNIIFYFSDQQRADTVNETVMPNLSALASEGTNYSNAFTCQPVCGPARACLQTGVNATVNGCYKNNISLPKDIKPLAEYFTDDGYQTAYVGKWHLASDSNFKCHKTAIPKDRLGGYEFFRGSDVLEFTSHGYDGYVFDEDGNKLDFTGYRVDAINDYALEFLDNRDEDKPFFLFISQLEPHHQNDRHCYEGYKPTVDDFNDYPIPEDLTGFKGDYVKSYPNYLSAINRIDYNLGKLVDKLKALGIYDDTYIVYSSDHGSHFKTRNLEYKRSCHEGSIHIPLVVKGGVYNTGKVNEKLVSLLDYPATFLSMAELDVPASYQGFDLASSERECVFVQISESHCGRCVRTKDFKFSVKSAAFGYVMPTKNSSVYFEDYLYDLNADPFEKNNLIKNKKYDKIKQELKELLIKQMLNAGEKEPKILSSAYVKQK